MRKSVHSPEGKCLSTILVELRKKAGVTQRVLAERLEREYSMIGRLEKNERRLDVVEFCWWCEALGVDPEAVFHTFMKAIRRTDAYMEETRKQQLRAAEPKEPYRTRRRSDRA